MTRIERKSVIHNIRWFVGSVNRWLDYLAIFGHLQQQNICPIAKASQFGQILNKLSEKCQRLFKFCPKWRNVANSGHTVGRSKYRYKNVNKFGWRERKSVWVLGSRHSSVVSSAPTILRPWVRIPSTPSMLFSICITYWNCNEKRTKINKKRPGLAHLKKSVMVVARKARKWFGMMMVWANVTRCWHKSSSIFPKISPKSSPSMFYFKHDPLQNSSECHPIFGLLL